MLPIIYIYAVAGFVFDRTTRTSPNFEFRALTNTGESLRSLTNSDEFLGLKEMGALTESAEESTLAYKALYPSGYQLVYVPPEKVNENADLQAAIQLFDNELQGKGPTNTVLPVISGTPNIGQTLTVSNGTWSSGSSVSYSYAWTRNGSVINGETSSTYLVEAVDFGASIGCIVSATNEDGTRLVRAPNTPPVSGGVPVITKAIIDGTAEFESLLTANYSVESFSPLSSLSIQWKSGGNVVADETGFTYRVRRTDVSQAISYALTAVNPSGQVSGDSSPTTSVLGPPSVITSPVVTGSAVAGSTLTSTTGTWRSNPTATTARVWLRNGNPIASATAATYQPVEGDIDSSISVRVTASNSYGSLESISNVVGPITGSAPVNTVVPAISGTVRVGSVLTASNGTWIGIPSPTFTHQWKREGVNIAGATNTTYTLQTADYDAVITVTVTATNNVGSASATSSATAAVAGATPANTTAPTITGTPTVGQSLTVSNGAWTGTPTPTYTRQWKRAGVDISGATGASYTLVAADYDTAITATVTATNAAGSASATSAATANIAGLIPTNTVLPVVTGTATVGQTLTTTNGTWTGTPTPTYTRQWKREGANIPSATGTTYVLTAADAGAVITVTVTGTNAVGNNSVTSVGTSAVAGSVPINTTIPVITGTKEVGETVTVSNGTWTGTPTPTYTRQWKLDGTVIAGATAATYVLVEEDIEGVLTADVTATNLMGSASASALPL